MTIFSFSWSPYAASAVKADSLSTGDVILREFTFSAQIDQPEVSPALDDPVRYVFGADVIDGGFHDPGQFLSVTV
jgi:hypothetical protein